MQPLLFSPVRGLLNDRSTTTTLQNISAYILRNSLAARLFRRRGCRRGFFAPGISSPFRVAGKNRPLVFTIAAFALVLVAACGPTSAHAEDKLAKRVEE